MNIIINNKRKNFKEVNYVKLYELIKNSNFNHNLEGDDFHHSILNFNKNHNIDSMENQYANFDQLLNLSEDIERTRRVRKRILEYIPNKILQIKTEQNTVDKQSFRLSKNQYKKSKESIKNKMKKYKHQTKEYNREIYKRIRYVYKVYSYLIPSLYVIKRPSYNVVQCKWKFMGIIQKQIHLGTFKKVGHFEEDRLKEIALDKINDKYNGFFDKLSLKDIIKEKRKLTKWCNDIDYRAKQ